MIGERYKWPQLSFHQLLRFDSESLAGREWRSPEAAVKIKSMPIQPLVSFALVFDGGAQTGNRLGDAWDKSQQLAGMVGVAVKRNAGFKFFSTGF